jgi:hypothetical protein
MQFRLQFDLAWGEGRLDCVVGGVEHCGSHAAHTVDIWNRDQRRCDMRDQSPAFAEGEPSFP